MTGIWLTGVLGWCMSSSDMKDIICLHRLCRGYCHTRFESTVYYVHSTCQRPSTQDDREARIPRTEHRASTKMNGHGVGGNIPPKPQREKHRRGFRSRVGPQRSRATVSHPKFYCILELNSGKRLQGRRNLAEKAVAKA